MSPPETTTRGEWVREALERHEASLLRYAESLTRDPDLARDVVQDTFLRLCEQDPEELADRYKATEVGQTRRRIFKPPTPPVQESPEPATIPP